MEDIFRTHEEKISETRILLNDFIKRYDRDRLECAQRYKEEHDESRIWRSQFDRKLDEIDRFISEMRPNYRIGMYFAGMVILGALGLVFKIIWNSVTK